VITTPHNTRFYNLCVARRSGDCRLRTMRTIFSVWENTPDQILVEGCRTPNIELGRVPTQAWFSPPPTRQGRTDIDAMTAPQTPRRSNRQQNLPARYGGGILISTSQTYNWPAHPLHTRPAQPTDFLPDENIEPGETHLYSSLIRQGPPSKPVVRTYGKQRSAKLVASGSKMSEKFSVGDTVLVVSPAKVTNIAVITMLWRVVRKDDEVEDDEDPSESMRIRVHWFTRPAQLGTSRQKRDCLPVSSLSF
jgi:hypothetical protein